MKYEQVFCEKGVRVNAAVVAETPKQPVRRQQVSNLLVLLLEVAQLKG